MFMKPCWLCCLHPINCIIAKSCYFMSCYNHVMHLIVCLFTVYKSRGVPKIFCRGFPQVVDPRCGGLGAQPPDADELFIFAMSPWSVF